jgi:hypothetical protein
VSAKFDTAKTINASLHRGIGQMKRRLELKLGKMEAPKKAYAIPQVLTHARSLSAKFL